MNKPTFAQIQDQYWEELIASVAQTMPEHKELTPETVKEIINLLLNDDEVWNAIDSSIKYYLQEDK